jgi:hypothetical protein
MPNFRRNSDAFAVHKLKAISISPLSLDFTPKSTAEIRNFESKIALRLKKITEESSSRHK